MKKIIPILLFSLLTACSNSQDNKPKTTKSGACADISEYADIVMISRQIVGLTKSEMQETLDDARGDLSQDMQNNKDANVYLDYSNKVIDKAYEIPIENSYSKKVDVVNQFIEDMYTMCEHDKVLL